MTPYYPELHDEKKIHRQISSLVSRFEEWGILKKVRDREEGLYRVERIIKAKLPPEKLAEVRDQIKRRLPEIDDETEKKILSLNWNWNFHRTNRQPATVCTNCPF